MSYNRLTILIFFFLAACGEPQLASTCKMNGLGSGSCSFTNTGNASGAVCGAVRLTRVTPSLDLQTAVMDATNGRGDYVYDFKKMREPARAELANAVAVQRVLKQFESSVFCSGQVAQQETRAVDFTLSDIDALCGGGGEWVRNCELGFVVDAGKPSSAGTDRPNLNAPLEAARKEAQLTIDAIQTARHQVWSAVELDVGLIHMKSRIQPSDIDELARLSGKGADPSAYLDPWGQKLKLERKAAYAGAIPVVWVCSAGLDKQFDGADICDSLVCD